MHWCGATGGPANSTSPVDVWVQSDDGTFDPIAMRTAAWTINVADAAAGAGGWRIAALLSDPAIPVEGGVLRFRVEGFTTSNIAQWSIRLLPEFNLQALNWTDPQQMASINASMVIARGIACGSAVAEDPDTASCKLPVVPPGKYLLAVTVGGSTHILLPSSGTLSSSFGLYSVSPNLGSIGGSTTLMLKGRGFDALQQSTAVVVIKVRCVYDVPLTALANCNANSYGNQYAFRGVVVPYCLWWHGQWWPWASLHDLLTIVCGGSFFAGANQHYIPQWSGPL